MKVLLEKNKQNKIKTAQIFKGIQTLMAGRLYRSGEVVLGKECLNHVKNMQIEKEKKLMTVLDTHRKAYL